MNKRDQTFPLYRAVLNGNVIGTFDLASAVRGAPKFLVTNLADTLMDEEGTWGIGISRDLSPHPVRPPFKRLWMEAELPPRTLSESLEERIGPGHLIGMSVIECGAQTTRALLDQVRSQGFDLPDELEVDTERVEQALSADRSLMVTVFEGRWFGSKVKGICRGQKLVPVDATWRVFSVPSVKLGYLAPTLLNPIEARNILHRDREVRDVGTSVDLALFGFAMLHCKNVETESVEYRPTRAVRRTAGMSKSPIDGPPSISYRVITVVVPGDDPSSSPCDATGVEMPWHICRGHFRTYSEERPMFGKYAGTFWVPAHTRGNKSVGVALKDYEEEMAAP